MITSPIIFTKKNPDNPLLEVLVESNSDKYEIIWYHWPHDGFMPVEDYEPVIVVYSKKQIKVVITRSAWKFKPHNIDNTLSNPLSVLFKDDFHHYMIRTEENAVDFDKIIGSTQLEQEEYQSKIKDISPSAIDLKFRTGWGHITNYQVFPHDDPADVAMQYYRAYCEE
ncbi:hypothetical protein [Nitrosopumilus maritimus]|uniref:Uncharacterized protein n=1 Tax=Nitrosopumilus maritimus (strain SCM1) TaxID=436308 RepID=A9A378_NITMS|nr:hypothetical protein [Nitrosopumilus maritimus]ABX12507.1 hypothetical protein Nmar_0611 [Nitrosopumilus maritimus SCM1]